MSKCKFKGQENFFNDFVYRSECGRVIDLKGSTVEEEEYKFCPYCGKEIEEVEQR